MIAENRNTERPTAAFDRRSQPLASAVIQEISLAAFHLYTSVKPAEGLEWDELSSDQRNEYRLMVLDAYEGTCKLDGEVS